MFAFKVKGQKGKNSEGDISIEKNPG